MRCAAISPNTRLRSSSTSQRRLAATWEMTDAKSVSPSTFALRQASSPSARICSTVAWVSRIVTAGAACSGGSAAACRRDRRQPRTQRGKQVEQRDLAGVCGESLARPLRRGKQVIDERAERGGEHRFRTCGRRAAPPRPRSGCSTRRAPAGLLHHLLSSSWPGCMRIDSAR